MIILYSWGEAIERGVKNEVTSTVSEKGCEHLLWSPSLSIAMLAITVINATSLIPAYSDGPFVSTDTITGVLSQRIGSNTEVDVQEDDK